MQERKTLLRRMMEKIRPKQKRPDIVPSEKSKLSEEKQEEFNKFLMKAALDGDNEWISRLIKKGAYISANSRDIDGYTVLHCAAVNGHDQTCLLIIQEYAKSYRNVKEFIAARDKEGKTALHKAVLWRRIQTCALILREYAKAGGNTIELITAKDNENRTALYYATKRGHTQIALFLMVKLVESIIGKERLYAFITSFNECLAA